jgi:hypothetical protein
MHQSSNTFVSGIYACIVQVNKFNINTTCLHQKPESACCVGLEIEIWEEAKPFMSILGCLCLHCTVGIAIAIGDELMRIGTQHGAEEHADLLTFRLAGG